MGRVLSLWLVMAVEVQSVRRSSGTKPSASAPGRLWSLNTPANHRSGVASRRSDGRLLPEAAAAGGRHRCAEGERGDAVGGEGGSDCGGCVPSQPTKKRRRSSSSSAGEANEPTGASSSRAKGQESIGVRSHAARSDGEITRRTSRLRCARRADREPSRGGRTSSGGWPESCQPRSCRSGVGHALHRQNLP